MNITLIPLPALIVAAGVAVSVVVAFGYLGWRRELRLGTVARIVGIALAVICLACLITVYPPTYRGPIPTGFR